MPKHFFHYIIMLLGCANFCFCFFSISGAEFQASDLGLLIENTSVEQLGLARKVTITKDSSKDCTVEEGIGRDRFSL
jgi:hypothetical protein